ncbi:hypothetical protein, partial [Phaeobacter sp.]|uniref:hypothetical protein n=1 Tax=Phaeobacter sp. TaxID=1902409 RepID=UPI0025EE0A1D
MAPVIYPTTNFTATEQLCLDVSFQQVVHSIQTELVGVTKHQPYSEGSNEHSQQCQTDTFGSSAIG